MMDVSIKVPLQRRAGAQNVSMDRSFAPSHSEKLESTLRHMVPALPKKGATPLVTYNVVVNNRWTVHRTSMRLDVTSWLLLDHIAEAEGYANRDVLISAVHERFHADDLPLTSLIRLFLQTYTAPNAVLSFLGQERRTNGCGFPTNRASN
ncbi:ribbon-helix-helix domain-containing protein [Azospirillum sp. 11R-A]|uniref:ribbon-helix-helix domain-containing protein n=1 Tax=Azospirillum sp. 11R-A TaxID=3111634 RepID=UPI003C247E56